ncbi:Nuclear pore complex protein Nup155 [Stylophora pistillata]|uniref:Nuclear pore complex protein Nup155 n=1 Tax=Stylophora pistillata TaxID=50429 RepID=A0A2B4SP37_STYPI|nr:Nuclear pore complex protein Nup155 [Stylophora pistillata]
MSIAVGNSSLGSMVTPEALENAAKEVDRQLAADRQFPELSEQISASQQIQTTFSGINDFDYPSLSSPSVGLAGLELVSLLKRVPLPSELMEQFNYMQCNCMMGLFPEIRRAWLTIDSNIYVWNYEDGSDSAYFDGLDETILCAGLVKAKPVKKIPVKLVGEPDMGGHVIPQCLVMDRITIKLQLTEIFKDEVKYILCLTTPIDIVLLAVTFTSKKLGSLSHDEFSEMHLHPNPVFSIPSDNIYMICITGTQSGRIFLGGKDGCVYEIAYQAADSWLPWRNCRKINHSSRTLSFLVPSFLSSTFSGEDAVAQLAVDNTRNILYARSEKGAIQVFDLGADGKSMSYVASLTQDKITHKAESAARTIDRNQFKPIVHIAPIARHESKSVHLVAITQAVEQLRQLLIQSQGFDSDSVHAFFKLYKEDQACATCLVLACSTQTSQQQIAEWATRAFFKYGESVSHHPTPAGTSGHPAEPSSTLGGSYIASPGVRQGFSSPGVVTSTPHPNGVGQAVVRPEVIRSSKHDGLCMYFARILETIWDSRLMFEDFLVPPPSEPQQPVPVLRSVLNVVQLGWILEKVRQLQTWMEQNIRFLLPNMEGGFPRVTMGGMQPFLQQTHQGSAETINAEKNFMMNFKSLVDRSVEILSLWQVLNEHNMEDVTLRLDTAIRDRLKHVKFRDLATKEQEICSALIASLINCFLDDSASTDIISEKLREVCPNLFSNDDAVTTKAGELLMLAKRSRDKAEQESILKDALQCYRQVTHQINLELICSLFESVRFYDGVVELSLYAALKRDPQGLALHFYRNGEPHGDVQGKEAFIARQQCYKCVLDCLQRLLIAKTAPSQSPGRPTRPGPPPAPDPNALTPHDAEKLMEDVLSFSLSYGDELWHVDLYQWLINNGLTDRLLEIKSPHLEVFLKRSSSQDQPNELKMLDLLWKHYEKTKNYSAAARVLSKLSEKQSPDVTLELRLEYLARAIMSAKSCNLRTSGSTDGEFLHELEEKLEVARIQMQVYQALVRINSANPSRRIDQALIGLNSQLLDVTTLYGDFADEFDLSECKLAIVHCAGHYDPTLIETLWRDIIEAELRDSHQNPPSDRMAIVRKKISFLGKVYVHSERYFPLGAIILMLEKKSAELVWDPTWVFMTMLEIGIPFPVLHAIYDKLFKAKDQCWRTLDKPIHILEVIYHLLMKFVNTPSISPPYERPGITIALYDACATYLVELQSCLSRDPSVQNTLAKFQGLRACLKRLLP